MGVQMISSINGAVLDTFTLTKPAGFKPDLAGRTAFLQSFKQTYFPGQNYPASIRYIEQTGGQAVLMQQHHDRSTETVSTVQRADHVYFAGHPDAKCPGFSHTYASTAKAVADISVASHSQTST